MRSWIMALMLLAGVPAIRAEEAGGDRLPLSKPPVREQLVAVVTAQLAAFRAEDWEKAYAAAAGPFQAVMAPAEFVSLITRKYPVVWKNTRAEFGLPSDDGRVAVVPVRVFGHGTSEAYNWLLVKEGKDWKVTGVVPQSTAGGA
jgi:hypothetical protein